MTSLLILILCVCLLWGLHSCRRRPYRAGRRLALPSSPSFAGHFNRLFGQARGETVSKSWVATQFRRHEYEIRMLRRRIKHRPGRIGRKNRIWGLDLTGKTNDAGYYHAIFGLVDHGTRANIALTALANKSSITLLRVLLNAIERFDKPDAVRTDNETVFTSRLFRFGLWFLGIRHQRTDRHCPWMNSRIERFFGTLKHKLNRWAVPDQDALNASLVEFRLWYNHVRPHQHLEDRTPAEVWNGIDIYRRRTRKSIWFNTWDGLLTGYYLPP